MKFSSLQFRVLSVTILCSIAPALQAQTTATTDPVGFITLTFAGTAASGGSSALSIQALGLTRSIEYQGLAETAVGGTNTITDNEAGGYVGVVPSSAVPYYVEIVSGTGVGTTYDISSIAGNTITLSGNLMNGMSGSASFKIRKHWTIATVFGASNTSGLQGGTLSTADVISVLKITGYDSYYYKTSGAGGTGWRKTTAPSTDASNEILDPNDGLVVSRKGSATSNVALVLTGSVKTGQTSYPVQTGTTIISNPYAAPMTLGSSNLYNATDLTHSLTGGTLSTADKVSLWNGTGYKTYYYKTSGAGGTGWRLTTAPSTDASGDPIAVGEAMVIQHNGTAFDWTIPQHPTNL